MLSGFKKSKTGFPSLDSLLGDPVT